MKRYGSVAVIGSLLLAACSSSSTTTTSPSPVPVVTSASLSPPPGTTGFTPPPTSPMKTYTSNSNGFQVDYPTDWTKQNKGGNCPATVCFGAPAQDGQVPAVIAVNVITWTSPTSLQTAWNTQRQLAINSLGVNPKTVSGTQGNTTLGGEQAKTATYTLDWGLIPATARQTMVLGADGTSATVLTGMSATEIWKDLDPTFAEVESSFALTG